MTTANQAVNTANRCRETTTTTGTGTINLGGAVPGYQTLVSGGGNTRRVYYTIAGPTEWEVGVGVLTSGSPDTLTRDAVLASSNGGSAVSFSAGQKDVFISTPPETYRIKDTLTLTTGSVSFQLSDSGITLNNNGASGLVTGTLPAASTAAAALSSPTQSLRPCYTFHVLNANGIKVACGSGDTLTWGNHTSATTGYAQSTEVGAVLEVQGTPAGWVITSMVGKWTMDAVGTILFPNHEGTLGVTVTPVSKSATGDGQTLSVPGNQMLADGDWLEIFGEADLTGFSGDINLKYGGTTIMANPGFSAYTGWWSVYGRVYRTGATAQYSVGYRMLNAQTIQGQSQTAAETLSGAVTVKTDCTARSAGTVVFQKLAVIYHRAA